MKFTWEASDIYSPKPRADGVGHACGVIVHKPGGKNERWIIGYGSRPDHTQGYALISLNDGMVGQFVTPEELADSLNSYGMIPVFETVYASTAVLKDHVRRLHPAPPAEED